MPDSDTLNFILRSVSPVRETFADRMNRGVEFVLSTVVHYEVTRYLKLKNSGRLYRLYHHMTTPWRRVGLDETDWDAAADLWARRHRHGMPIEDADLLIAVTALKSNATLVTNNTRHYQGLGLTLNNWSSP